MPSAEVGHLPTTLYMASAAARWPLCPPTMMAAQRLVQGEVIVQLRQWEEANSVFVRSASFHAFVCTCKGERVRSKFESLFLVHSLMKGRGRHTNKEPITG